MIKMRLAGKSFVLGLFLLGTLSVTAQNNSKYIAGKQKYLDLAMTAIRKLEGESMLPDGVPSSAEFLLGDDTTTDLHSNQGGDKCTMVGTTDNGRQI